MKNSVNGNKVTVPAESNRKSNRKACCGTNIPTNEQASCEKSDVVDKRDCCKNSTLTSKRKADRNLDFSLTNTFCSWEPYLEGSNQALVCVLASTELTSTAKNALNKALSSRNYGEDPCTFLKLDESMDANTLFEIIEGLDPLCLVVCDQKSARMLKESYQFSYKRGEETATICIKTEQVSRVFGRDALAFDNFEALLTSKDAKQHAWHLLKMLPAFEGQ